MDMSKTPTSDLIENYRGYRTMAGREYHRYEIYQRCADEAKKELLSRGIDVDNPEKIVTTPEYWDCNCKNDYIHPKSQKFCSLCNTHQDDAPDSRVYEVLGHGYSIG